MHVPPRAGGHRSVKQAPSSSRHQRWLWVMVSAWAAFMVFLFWFFTVKDLQVFAADEETLVRFSERVAQQVSVELRHEPAALEHQPVRLVVFWDAGCSCSRFSRRHIADIIDEYGQQGVVITIASPVEREAASVRSTFPGADHVVVVEAEDLSSPSAMILDEEDQIVYFGPFSDGALCLADGDSPVESMLDEALSGHAQPWLNFSSFGCYCRW